MTTAQIMERMIAYSEGNIHDIAHLSCVWTYAGTIGMPAIRVISSTCTEVFTGCCWGGH